MTVDDAIQTLSSADPIIKLLQEVKLGRMRATDPGLRVITESWIDSYRKIFEGATDFDGTALCRLDPRPRLAVLVAVGVLPSDHPGAGSLLAVFEQRLSAALNRAR
ncbi:hypothetical protein [Candidatus Nitrospira bockiana]